MRSMTLTGTWSQGDVNHDGNVNILDFNAMASNFGGTCPPWDHFEYDYANRLVRVTLAAGDASEKTIEYTYDCFGRRVRRNSTFESTTLSEHYYYGGAGLWQLCEVDPQGVLDTGGTFVHGSQFVDEVVQYVPEAPEDEHEAYYYHHDDLFSVMGRTDAYGEVTERTLYSDYGSPTPLNPGTMQFQTPGPYGRWDLVTFQGREWDQATLLIQSRNRWLDPAHGRFKTRDPAGYVDGMNLLGFVSSNPASAADPLGLWKWQNGKRQGQQRATMIADQGDTTDSAAQFSMLSAIESAKWLQEEESGEFVSPGDKIDPGCRYSVPNTVYVTVGNVSWIGSQNNFGRPFRDPKRAALPRQTYHEAERYQAHMKERGYYTVWQADIEKAQFTAFAQNPNTTALFFIGHGMGGSLWSNHLGPGGWPVPIRPFDLNRSLHHKLSMLTLFACEAGRDSGWRQSVSENGVLRASNFSLFPGSSDWYDIPRVLPGDWDYP